MREFYIMHDVENKRIGLIPANPDAAPIDVPVLPDIPKLPDAGMTPMLIGLIISLVCFGMIAACYCIKLVRDRRNKGKTFTSKAYYNNFNYPPDNQNTAAQIQIDSSQQHLLNSN